MNQRNKQFANLLRNLLVIAVTTSALCACDQDMQTEPESLSVLMKSTSASTPMSGNLSQTMASSASAIKTSEAPQGLAGFAQIWSSDQTTTANYASEAVSVEQSAEFKQLRQTMDTLDFERARKNASTPALKAAVEREYRMHIEMLDTEMRTAKADQEKGSKEP